MVSSDLGLVHPPGVVSDALAGFSWLGVRVVSRAWVVSAAWGGCKLLSVRATHVTCVTRVTVRVAVRATRVTSVTRITVRVSSAGYRARYIAI